MLNSRQLFVLIFAASASLLSGSVMAQSQWQKDHPRREQVNQRLDNQGRRIHDEVKEGQISKSQAHALHQEDHQIRHEEKNMAHHDGGHLTRADQKTLNQQEDAVSRQIGR